MSSGCGDVLSLEDLKTAKKHQTFEAEVITGRTGGLSTGAEIDIATNPVTGQTQKTMPAILRDIGFSPASFDFTTGGTLTVADRDAVVFNPVDNNWYSWVWALPHVVAAGTDPTADSNWKPRTDQLLRQNLGSSEGAGLSGFDPFLQYPDGTVGGYLVQTPTADNSGVNNSLSSFNSAIKKLALKGGGTLKPDPGIYLISGGSILWPSNIRLDLKGVTLKGDGTNTIVKSGAVVGGELVDITNEYGTGDTGNGSHFVWRSEIIGGILTNAAIGIRGHRLNYGTVIRGTHFTNTLGKSWVTSHSWGLKITECTAESPAIMKDFVDWTEVSGNSFEGNNGWNDNYAALTITTGGYGGSYSARIVSNGFHRMHIGIYLTCEMANSVIEDNHFEATVKHIVGNNDDKRGFRIKNNWMKANLLNSQSAAPAVTPMTFGFLRDSEIGPNRFSNDRGPDYDYYISGASSNVFGNKVFAGYKTNNDFTKFNLNITNVLEVIRGGNSTTNSFPEIDLRSGNGAYTFEKYRSVYNYVANQIPNCSITYSGSVVTIKTWIPWTPIGTGGCVSFCAFHFNVFGSSRTLRLAGRFNWNVVSIDVNKEIYGGSAVLGMTLSGSDDGYTVINITNAPVGGGINGWVKEL